MATLARWQVDGEFDFCAFSARVFCGQWKRQRLPYRRSGRGWPINPFFKVSSVSKKGQNHPQDSRRKTKNLVCFIIFNTRGTYVDNCTNVSQGAEASSSASDRTPQVKAKTSTEKQKHPLERKKHLDKKCGLLRSLIVENLT